MSMTDDTPQDGQTARYADFLNKTAHQPDIYDINDAAKMAQYDPVVLLFEFANLREII